MSPAQLRYISLVWVVDFQHELTKVVSYRIAIQHNDKNPFRFACPFEKPAIHGRPFNPESIKPTNRQEVAFAVVKLPIIGRPFGGCVFIYSHGAHSFVSDNQRSDRHHGKLVLFQRPNRKKGFYVYRWQLVFARRE
jgi:hypothetical protein